MPLSAILFGGRRARTVPLVYRSFDWEHGVFLGATMASETTAAATGAVGVVRRDPDGHAALLRLQHGRLLGPLAGDGRATPANPPAIFQVNWFRTDDEGRYIWPGFGENMRVLRWVRERVRGETAAPPRDADGLVPTPRRWAPADLGLRPGVQVESLFESIARIGCAKRMTRVNSSKDSATGCPRRVCQESTARSRILP